MEDAVELFSFVKMLFNAFRQIFHRIKGTLQSHEPPGSAKPLTLSFLYEEEPPPLKSTPYRSIQVEPPISNQLPTGAYRTRAAISWFPSRNNEPI